MPTPPRSFLLLPDPVLMGAGSGPVLAYLGTLEPDGRRVDIATPAKGNRGAAAFLQSGSPRVSTGLTYRVVASGGIWNEGTWAWKLASEAEPARAALGYRGQNDARYYWAGHDPFRHDGNNTGTFCGVYSSLNLKEFVYRSKTSTNVEVAYRSVDTHEYSHEAGSGATWTITNCLNSDTGLVLSAPGSGTNAMAVVELRDGTLLMVLESEDEHDLNVFHSTDGINWTPVADNILARFGRYDTDLILAQIQLTRSGDYIRLTFPWWGSPDGGITDAYLRTLVSADRGASWYEVPSDLTTYFDVRYSVSNGYYGMYYAMGGLDDDAGTCMLLLLDESSGTTVRVFIASGQNDWTYYSDLNISMGLTTTVYHLACARGPEYFYVWVWNTPSGSTLDTRMFYIDPRNITQLSGWKYESYSFAAKGALAYFLVNMRPYTVGNNYLAMTACLADTSYNAQSDREQVYMRFGGWDKLPVEERDHPELSDRPDYQHQPGALRSVLSNPDYQLHIIAWDSWMGAAAPSGGTHVATSTPWSRSSYSGISSSWNTSRWKFTDQIAVNNVWVNQYTDSSPTFSWACETDSTVARCSCMLETVLRVPSGGDPANDAIAARLRSYDVLSGSGKGIDVSIRYSNSQVCVRDNAAGTDIIAATTISNISSRFIKFRLGFLSQPWKSGDPVAVILWARDEEDPAADWQQVGTGTAATTATHGTQDLRWGHLTTVVGAGRVSEWRRVALFGPHDGGSTRTITDAWGDTSGGAGNDDSVLDNLRGRLMTYDEVLVRKGVKVTVSGGGAFEGDSFDGAVDYAYHPKNMHAVGSPRVRYQSATPSGGTPTAVNIDYDAGWDDTGRRFVHDAFAAFGFSDRELKVVYADDSAFTSGLVTYTLSMDRYGPFRIAAADGNTLQVAKTDAQCPPRGEVHTEPNGGLTHYLRITALAGGASNTALGKVYVVEHDFEGPSGRGFKLDTADENLASYSLVGCSAVIYADRGVVLYGTTTIKRYMRLSMAATTTAYGGQHRLGTIMPGLTLVFDPALDWTHSDGEAGNVTEVRSRGAVRWGYAEGPPQRVWEGNVVGDTDYLRRQTRAYMRALAQYDVFPVTLVTDDSDLKNPAKIVLGTIKSGVQFSNEAWKWHDTNQRWEPAGNMKIQIEEEP